MQSIEKIEPIQILQLGKVYCWSLLIVRTQKHISLSILEIIEITFIGCSGSSSSAFYIYIYKVTHMGLSCTLSSVHLHLQRGRAPDRVPALYYAPKLGSADLKWKDSTFGLWLQKSQKINNNETRERRDCSDR